jgi:hypothetical protein
MADVEKIPTDPTLGDWEQVTTLDGVPYLLRFRYNSRSDRYFLSVFTEDGDPLFHGKKVTINADLLRQVADPDQPSGEIRVFHQATGLDPRFGELGDGAEAFYLDEEILAIMGV